jgi:hypothetical protein
MAFIPRSGVVLLLLGVVAGCASTPPPHPTRARSLSELYEIADEANEKADPYELGTGDPTGRMIHRAYRSEGMAAAQVK